MKVAVYLEEGFTQLIITPEDEPEKKALALIDGQKISVHRGEFYHCRGGWVVSKDSPSHSASMYASTNRNAVDSLIIVVEKTEEDAA